MRAWRGEIDLRRLIPEGHDDVSVELATQPLHPQVKSRRSHRGDFSDSDDRGGPVFADLRARTAREALVAAVETFLAAPPFAIWEILSGAEGAVKRATPSPGGEASGNGRSA